MAHLDASWVRKAVDGESVYVSRLWDAVKRKTDFTKALKSGAIEEIPFATTKNAGVVYSKSYAPGRKDYGLPDYLPAGS